MADDDSSTDGSGKGGDDAAGASQTDGAGASESTDGGDAGFLSRFGGSFATIAGGLAAFVLMLGIGGFVAFQLLAGPGDGAAAGPISVDAPDEQSSGGNGSGGSGGSGSNAGSDGAAKDENGLQNPKGVIEPNDQFASEAPGSQLPTGNREGSFQLRLSKESAEPYENIVWRGTFRGRGGSQLELQNKQGSEWADYRESAVVAGNGRYRGTFSVGAVGVNEFRVVDPRTGMVSNVVQIEIY